MTPLLAQSVPTAKVEVKVAFELYRKAPVQVALGKNP